MSYYYANYAEYYEHIIMHIIIMQNMHCANYYAHYYYGHIIMQIHIDGRIIMGILLWAYYMLLYASTCITGM